jgi:periplasmic protein CpxP/Spy
MKLNSPTLWMTLVAVLAAAVALVTISAQTQEQGPARPDRPGEGRGFGPGRGMGPGPGLTRLNLTDQQRKQVRAIMQEARTGNEAPGQKAGELRRELHIAIFADSPDHGRIDQLKAAIAGAEASALEARIATDLKIAQILTPEQRAQAREARGRRGGGRGERGLRR